MISALAPGMWLHARFFDASFDTVSDWFVFLSHALLSLPVTSEIFIDTIARLEILTSTRRINVGDVEALQLAAYDSMDNVFSSLDGLPFTWVNTDQSILKEISLQESGLVVAASIWELDRSEVATNIQPVRGAVPGRINMTVSLADPAHPISTGAEFLVIEPLFLKPSSARLCPGSELRVQLLTRFKEERVVHTDRTEDSQGEADATIGNIVGPVVHRREIAMPSLQYKWSSLAPTIASIDKDTGLLVARHTGSTRVRVGDVNLPEHRRESEILVVEPASIALELRALTEPASGARRVTCDGSYFINVGATYELTIYLLDASGFKIAVTPNMAFGFSTQGSSVVRASKHDATPASPLPPNSAQATPTGAASVTSTPSSSSIYLLGATGGVTTISVSLSSVRSVAGGIEYVLQKDGRPTPLTQAARIVVTPAVTVDGPTPLRLPLIAPAQPTYALRAIGGSGQFAWGSATPSVALVSSVAPGNSSSADLVALSLGESRIQVTDACNPESSSGVDVHVIAPARVEFIQTASSKREAVTDANDKHNALDVYVRVRSSATGRAFDDCSALFLHASFATGTGVFALQSPSESAVDARRPSSIFQCATECPVEAGSNCFHLRLRATKPGLAQLRVNLVDSASVHGVPLAAPPAFELYSAFAPLAVEPSPLLLSLHSPQVVQHLDGPLAWSRGGFGGGALDAAAIESAKYDHVAETLFAQTYLTHAAADAAVYDRAELAAAPWLKHDVTADGFISIKPVAGAPHQFTITCLRAGEPLALHIVVSNARDLQTVHNPLANPLAAHGVIRVHCFPPLRLAPEPASVGIGETKQVRLADPAYPLASLVRFAPEVAGDATFRINDTTGEVTGLRLGQGHVRAAVDRTALLVQLGYAATTPQPWYKPDGLVAHHLLRVEFDAFRVTLSSPHAPGIMLRSQTTVATVVGASHSGPSPLDESFEHVQCAWSVESNAAHGVAIAPALSALTAVTSTEDLPPVVYGCAVRVHALKSGVHTLRVRITVSLPASGSSSRADAHFDESVVLHVVDPLTLLSPSSLLLPHGSSASILTNFPPRAQRTNASSPSVQYSVLSYACRTANGAVVNEETHVPYVTVDDRGVISVRARSTGDGDQDAADAVVLVQTVHEPASPCSSLVSPVTQSQVVLVSVRPVSQLFVVASGGVVAGAGNAQLLCPSRNYSLGVGVSDPLGRRFDVSQVDGLLGALNGNLSVSGRGELPIQLQRAAAAASAGAGEQVLSQFVLHVGEAPSEATSNADAQTLHALQDFTLQFALATPSTLPPLFMQFYVAPAAMCTEPAAVLLSLRLTLAPSAWQSDYPAHSVHRDSFVASLVHDVATALELSSTDAARVKVVNVDVATSSVELLLLPRSFATELHRDQWFMAYFVPAQAATNTPAHLAPEAWLSAPLALAQSLQRQAADRSREAALWRGSLTSLVDAKSPFASVEVPTHDAERLLRERRGQSSSLSGTSAAGVNTPPSSTQSVWSDERDYATWSRVLDSSRTSERSAETTTDGVVDSAAEVVGAADVAAIDASEKDRREEEEAKWKELKRRYELERLRDSGPEWAHAGSASWTVLFTLLTVAALAFGVAFLYWHTFVAFMPGRGARLNLPVEQQRGMPEHDFFVWLFQSVCGCGSPARRGQRGGVVGAQPIDPMNGPNDALWQQQRAVQQPPPVQIFDDFQHIDHQWQ